MTVTLPPEFEAIVRLKVETGRYEDADAVIKAALILLDAHERRLDRLRAAVAAADEQFQQGKYARWTPELRARLKQEAEEVALQGPTSSRCPSVSATSSSATMRSAITATSWCTAKKNGE